MPAAKASSTADETETGDEHGPCRGFRNGDGVDPVDDDVLRRLEVRIEGEDGVVDAGGFDQDFARGEKLGLPEDTGGDFGCGDGLAKDSGREAGIADVS